MATPLSNSGLAAAWLDYHLLLCPHCYAPLFKQLTAPAPLASVSPLVRAASHTGGVFVGWVTPW